MAVTWKWQACEMWSVPGAAAVDVESPQEVGTGWSER